jgi:hypothetical protein
MPPLTSLALRLVLATACFLAGPTFAATKLDLSPYLGILPEEGDFKVFTRSTGGERELIVLELEPWKKGWRGVVSSEVSGAGADFDGTVLSEEFLIPGRQLLSGSEIFDTGLTFFARRPSRGLKLLITPGRTQRINQNALALFGGTRVGNVRRRGTWSVDGHETVDTPSGSYENALRARAFSNVRLKLRRGAIGCSNGACGNELVQLIHTTLWYAGGLGLVRVDIDFEFLVDGSLSEAASWTEELSSFGNLEHAP